MIVRYWKNVSILEIRHESLTIFWTRKTIPSIIYYWYKFSFFVSNEDQGNLSIEKNSAKTRENFAIKIVLQIILISNEVEILNKIHCVID